MNTGPLDRSDGGASTTARRTTHAATQTIGLLLITGALLFVVAVSLVLFGGEDVAVFVVLAMIASGSMIVTRRFDTQWARALGVAGTILSLGAFFLGFGLLHPFSPLEFTVAVAYVGGMVLSLAGGVLALLAGRAGRRGPSATEGRLPRVVLGVMGAAAVVSMLGFVVTRQDVADSDAAGATVIDMAKFEFVPDPATTAAGSSLLITNSDPFVHDFTLEELRIAVTVGPRSEALIDLSGVAPGTYEYVCTLHYDGTSGMTGTLVVDG